MSDPIVEEVAATGPSDDPILSGTRLDPGEILARLPDRPPTLSRPPRIVNQIDWQPAKEAVVQPGGALDVTMPLSTASALFARASWFGSATAPALAAELNGTEVARGDATLAPPDAGAITLTARLTESGALRVAATNPGGGQVTVRLVVGVAPL